MYEASKSFLGRHSSSLGLPQPLVHSSASAIAECASCLVLTPAEVIKQNAQMLQRRASSDGSKSRFRNSTSLQALRQLGGADAGRRLLSGYAALVARNLPFTAIQFPIFESIRTWMWRRHADGDADSRSGGSGNETRGLLETGLGMLPSFPPLYSSPLRKTHSGLLGTQP